MIWLEHHTLKHHVESFYCTVPLFLKDVEGFITAEVSSVVSGWLERHRMNEGGVAG